MEVVKQTAPHDECLTVDEVARRLKVSVRTVWAYSKGGAKGFPKPRRFGAVTRWRESDLNEYIRDMGR